MELVKDIIISIRINQSVGKCTTVIPRLESKNKTSIGQCKGLHFEKGSRLKGKFFVMGGLRSFDEINTTTYTNIHFLFFYY